MRQFTAAAMTVGFFVSVCATGCKTMQPTQKGNPASIVDVERISQIAANVLPTTVVAYDSIVDGIKCDIWITFPDGCDSIAENVKNFIAQELTSLCLPYNNEEEDGTLLREYPFYKGDFGNGSLMINHYGDGIVRYLSRERKDLEAERIQKNEMPVLSQVITIDLGEVTPAYITYNVDEDNYLGGAHHSRTSYCKNISRKTTKPVVNTLDSARLRDLQPLLRENVLRCLKASGVESVTDSSLENYLILSDDGLIPLPIHEPWLEHGCLKFVYQPYEIASYAVGTICFSIAVKDLMPYLTDEAKDLLN